MNSADQLAWTAQYFKRLEQQLERINSIQDIQDIHGKMIEVLPKNGVEPNPLSMSSSIPSCVSDKAVVQADETMNDSCCAI